MREITIDCRDFCPRINLHRAFAQALSFPEHYGNNLDALHDCLTAVCEDTRIRLLYWETAEAALGSYGRIARRAIAEAAAANPKLTVLFD